MGKLNRKKRDPLLNAPPAQAPQNAKGRLNPLRRRPLDWVLLALALSGLLACKTVTRGLYDSSQWPTATALPTVAVTRSASATPQPGASPAASETAPSASAVTPQPVETATLEAIQAALDLYVQAYNENQPELLDQAIDTSNKPFRRLAQSRFDDFQKSYRGGSGYPDLWVQSAETRPHGFLLARLQLETGMAADWNFRQVDGRWVISEPSVEQIGPSETITSPNFVFTTYPWAEDVNTELVALMEDARTKVEGKLGKAPEERAQVEVRPIYGLDPFTAMGALAYYQAAGARGPDKIVIYSPHSFAYGFFDPEIGWQGDLGQVLVHEYTHMVHNLSFDNAGGKLVSWMSEGLAEYVSGADYDRVAACRASKQGQRIPLVDRKSKVNKQDLGHMYILDKDRGLAYAYAYTLVAYIVETHGGLDGFWKLAQAHDELQDMDEALQQAFGVSLDEFERDWLEWVEQGC